MHTPSAKSIVVVLVVILIATCCCCAQERCTVMFYNVENLFDTENDPLTADEDMLPKSDRAWTETRYEKKLQGISRVISDLAQEGELPAIVGLAEVENLKVLEDLVVQADIKTAKYAICHYDSPDERGIDVALLYRPDVFVCQGSRVVKAVVDEAPHLRTRDMLLVWGILYGEQVLFSVVHWPSRIGGVKQTEHLREGCAEQLRMAVDSIMLKNPDIKVVVMGDMNDNPNCRSVRKVLGAHPYNGRVGESLLYSVTARGNGGTSVYDGRWNRYDTIAVSANLLDISDEGLKVMATKRRESVRYIDEFVYLLDDKGHPKATYRGSDYLGGVSDHLPIRVILGR